MTTPGRVEVRSGRTGALLLDLPGFSNYSIGYAVADAGDVDGDGLHDIIASGPYNDGRARVYSGRRRLDAAYAVPACHSLGVRHGGGARGGS